MAVVLLISVFIIATCGLIYELIAGTLASYLLGDSVTQFSTIIGAYLFSMGIGSWISKYVKRNLVSTFIRVELLIAIIGGFSAMILFLSFDYVQHFRVLLYGQVSLTGILVGLEIPLLMRILKDEFEFENLVSNVFTFDYIGALAASVLFPMLLVPYLGLMRTALLFGLFNAAVAIWAIYIFRNKLQRPSVLFSAGAFVVIALLTGFVLAERVQEYAEGNAYQANIIYAKSSPYQRVVLTRDHNDLRLYLNGNLQFSTRDEYRYHEALVHPGLAGAGRQKKILILGGGDGLAMREVLRYPGVENITLVDLDPIVTQLFRSNQDLKELNQNSLDDPRLQIVNEDAFQWIRQNPGQFDFVIIDFPDPGNYSLGKLYSLTFFRELKKVMAPGSRAVIQCTSPLVARKSFWCVNHTLEAAGFLTQPYHCYVPSFGEWGFIMFAQEPVLLPETLPQGMKFLTTAGLPQMFQFPADMQEVPTEINQLNNQALVQYFESEWGVYEE